MELDLNHVTDRLCNFVRTELLPQGTDGVTPARPLRDLGLDSFALIELLLFSENQFGVRIPDAELVPDNLRNVEALARCIQRTRPK